MSVKVFFYYAHEDEAFLKELKAHLKPLQQRKLISIWYDGDISAGMERRQEIDKRLAEAEIILLLVSPAFMNHDYCYSDEMQKVVEWHEREQSRVVPIILRPILWEDAPFGKLQALPKDATPVTLWLDRDSAFLASILRSNRSLRLATLLDNLLYNQKWKEDIAQRLLDYIYKQQLDEVQRKWLVSFAVYRHPVPIEAVQQILQLENANDQSNTISALDALLAQHLLQNGSSGSELYQLHTIVAEYAKDHIDVKSRKSNRDMLRKLHAKAAEYYVQCTEKAYTFYIERTCIDDVKFIIETIWHYCQAGYWKEAYTLMLQESLFDSLELWGNIVELLELCQLLLPSPEWQPGLVEKVFIYRTIARVCNSLDKREQSLEYNKQTLKIQREINDYEGEGKTLHDIGMLYLKRGQLAYGFACVRLALYIFETIKSVSDCENEKLVLQEIQKAINAEDYTKLLATVEPQTYQVVEQALRANL